MTLTDVIAWINTDRIGAFGDAGTALAFGLAALIYGQDRRSKRRAQAEQVSAWLQYVEEGDEPEDPERWGLQVRNGSDRPIYQVLLIASVGAVEHIWYPVLPPATTESVRTSSNLVEDLSSSYSAGITMDFTDASGRRWRRRPSGRLHGWRRRHGEPTNPELRRETSYWERKRARGREPYQPGS